MTSGDGLAVALCFGFLGDRNELCPKGSGVAKRMPATFRENYPVKSSAPASGPTPKADF